MPPTKTKAQINPGLSLWLDEKRGSRQGLVDVEFIRVALTEQQVRDYALPTAPAKATDSRAKAWIGETCQLEALTPKQIADEVERAIEDRIEPDQFNSDVATQWEEKQRLTRLLLPAPGGGA